ncbi:MAG: HepT-like ribonuclease domain-containing protein [Longimicrobiales bacterium]
MKRPDPALLLDMLLAARRAERFAQGILREDLDRDEMRQDALVRALTVLGEAAGRVSEETRTEHSEIPWPQIVGMRNRLVHEYFRIDLDVVWNVVSTELGPLINALQAIVPPEV